MPHRLHPRPAATPLPAVALATVLAGLVPGCAAPDPGPAYTRVSSGDVILMAPADATKLDLSATWVSDLELDAGQEIRFAEVLGDLLVITQSPDPIATVVELDTGEIRWERSIGQQVSPLSRALRQDDELMFIADAVELFGFDVDTADLVRRQPLDTAASSQPVLHGELVLYGGLNGRVTGHNLRLGFGTWQYQLPAEIETTPAVRDNQVLVAAARGTYAMLLSDTGGLLWRGRTFDAVTADPSFAEAAALVASEDGSLYALDFNTGQDLWVHQTTTPLTEPAFPLGRNVYLPVPGQALLALDATSGEVLWRIETLGGRDTLPVMAMDDDLLAVRGNALLVLDPDDGREKLSLPTADPVRIIEGPNDSLLLVTDDGRVNRFDAQP